MAENQKPDQGGSAQFKQGREQAKKLQTDPDSHRLDSGNPDIGDVDMGVIEADKPTKKDDNSPFTEP